MRACLNQSTVNQTDAQTFVEAAASVGFQGVEFRVEKLRAYLASNHRWSQLKGLLTDHHIESVCLNSFEDFSYVPVENFDAVSPIFSCLMISVTSSGPRKTLMDPTFG